MIVFMEPTAICRVLLCSLMDTATRPLQPAEPQVGGCMVGGYREGGCDAGESRCTAKLTASAGHNAQCL